MNQIRHVRHQLELNKVWRTLNVPVDEAREARLRHKLALLEAEELAAREEELQILRELDPETLAGMARGEADAQIERLPEPLRELVFRALPFVT